MATHKSSEKRARQTIKRNETNRARRSVVASLVKAVDHALTSKDIDGAITAARKAESALARGAGKTMHWKTAARKTSRLAKRVKALKKAK